MLTKVPPSGDNPSTRTTVSRAQSAQLVLIVERATTHHVPQFVPAMMELPLTVGSPGVPLVTTSQVTGSQLLVSV